MKSKNQQKQKRIKQTRRLFQGGKPVTTGEFESRLQNLSDAFSQLEKDDLLDTLSQLEKDNLSDAFSQLEKDNLSKAFLKLESVKDTIITTGNSVKGDSVEYPTIIASLLYSAVETFKTTHRLKVNQYKMLKSMIIDKSKLKLYAAKVNALKKCIDYINDLYELLENENSTARVYESGLGSFGNPIW